MRCGTVQQCGVGRKKNEQKKQKKRVPRPGFEPGSSEPQSDILPLNYHGDYRTRSASERKFEPTHAPAEKHKKKPSHYHGKSVGPSSESQQQALTPFKGASTTTASAGGGVRRGPSMTFGCCWALFDLLYSVQFGCGSATAQQATRT